MEGPPLRETRAQCMETKGLTPAHAPGEDGC